MTDISQPQVQALTGSEDYFVLVLTPNRDAFRKNPSTFTSALNLATSLFHFHEWLFEDYKPQLESQFGRSFSNKGDFWRAVQDSNSKFGYIRDVTNAAKHVRIGGSPNLRTSTGMSHIANTHIVTKGFDTTGFDDDKFGAEPHVIFSDSGNEINFDECADELYRYWRDILTNITGQNY